MAAVPQEHLDALETLRSSILEASHDLRLGQIHLMERQTRRVFAALKYARNLHVAVNRLPSEILERIFLLVRPHYDDFVPRWPDRKSLQWTAIEGVCTRWRNIARNLPSLWTIIDLCRDDPAHVGRAFLARSVDAPLTVFFASLNLEDSENDIYVLEEILLAHAHRVEALHIAVNSDDDLHAVCVLFRHTLPHLRSLSMFFRDHHNYRSTEWADGLASLDGMLPSVRKLAVQRCPIWQFCTFSGLTHLALCGSNTSTYREKYKAKTLRQLLDCSPSLVELILDEYASDRGLSGDCAISLPRLRTLQAAWDLDKEQGCLQFLGIPETCKFTPHFGIEGFATSAPGSPLNLHILVHSPLLRHIHTVQISPDLTQTRRISIHPGTFFISGIQDFAHLAGIVDPAVQLVICDTYHITDEDGWISLLSTMPRIRSLVVLSYELSYWDIETLFAALCSPAGANLCTALESLHLRGFQDNCF
ncbi:hypothetical protein BD626DRAFT_462222 [Schizophyllum amplum]|uniref:Uncharacterized protein n=1 Tax=Schizophyllum amplum TaxID=97359 RepID=A0A550C4C2_9AGAR|nr:hypothetical protein BD626DRAFT_462222 [Auriculariopsis ampla]